MAHSLNLTFKTLTGKVYNLDAKPEETLESVKEKVAELQECTKECLKIIKKGKVLKDDTKTMMDYSVEDGDKFMVAIKLMNAITQETMQGTWYWHDWYSSSGSPSAPHICVIEGKLFYWSEGRDIYTWVVSAKGFGIVHGDKRETMTEKQINNTTLYIPKGVKRDIIVSVCQSSQTRHVIMTRVPELPSDITYEKIGQMCVPKSEEDAQN